MAYWICSFLRQRRREDEIEDSTDFDVDAGSEAVKSPEGTTTLMGGHDLVLCESTYTVPSQLTQQSMQPPVPPQGESAADDFLPMYETACKFAKSTGAEGRQALEQDLNRLRDRQLEIVARKKRKRSRAKEPDPYGEYMHIYKNACEYCDEAGEEGQIAMRDEMNRIKERQAEIFAKQKGASKGGVASMPATSTKKVDRRIQSKCSPKKKGK